MTLSLQRRLLTGLSPATIFGGVLEVKDPVERLPARVNIGAAMLVQVDTSFRLFGYPALAIVFFVLAAVGAIGLILAILFGDE